jgi:hypothetical protein
VAGVGTAIIGGPRPLPPHRPASLDYTLICDEPVIWATHIRPGAAAVKLRSIKCGRSSACVPGIVVRSPSARLAHACTPAVRLNRSAVQRSTGRSRTRWPPRCSAAWTFRTPSTL